MLLCEHCSFTISASHDAHCPRCGQPTLRQSQAKGWVAIARVNNLAEVGYLADMLEGEGISSQVVQHNDFCAVSGTWTSFFVLRVAAENRVPAVQRLQDELGQLGEDSAWGDGDYASQRGRSLYNWRSVMLVLMAGGIAYYAGRGGLQPPRRPSPLRQSLWEALCESEQTFFTQPQPAATPQRLRFERKSRTIVLEDGPDGDGRLRVRRFQEGGLVEETIQPAK